MRRIIRTTVIAFALTLLVSGAAAQSATPEAQAKSFYAWYMHELNAEHDPLGNSKGLRPYVTARMIRSIERALKTEDGIDADIFIDAQDFDAKWEKNITTSRAVIRGASATLTVSLKGGPEWGTRRLRLVMKKEAGAWKIDSVNGHANP